MDDMNNLYETIGAALDLGRAFYYAHWNTEMTDGGQSYHELLKRAYEGLYDLADKLSERVRGLSGTNVVRVDSRDFASPSGPLEARKILLTFAKGLSSQDRGIENLFCGYEEETEALSDLLLNLL